MTDQKQREDKVYVVEDPDLGVIGVANSAVKAAWLALNYVSGEVGSNPPSVDQGAGIVRAIRSDGFVEVPPITKKGPRATVIAMPINIRVDRMAS